MRYAALAVCFSLTMAACGSLFDDSPGKDSPHAIPVVDEQKAKAQAGQPPAAAQAPTAAGAPFGTDQERSQVREWVRRLMDETRTVPATATSPGGPRGSAGSFAKLSSQQVEEFISAIIFAGDRFSPQSLPVDQRRVLVAVEISIESAFTPSTSGVNPGDNSKVSVGPLQLTLPGMWDDIFRQHAKIPGLMHADGSAWDAATTTREQFQNSIFDGVVSAYWCITEQGRRGVPEWLGGPDGPMPKTMENAYLGWVIGCQALCLGGDLAGQRDPYLASIRTDLTLLGYPASLIQTPF